MSASQDEIPPPPPPPPSSSQTPTQQTPHTVSTIKLPILKKGEYDIWAMKMEHYLAHTDYPIWEVIQNGNGPVSITTDTSGQIKVLPPRTAEEIVARERERKARTTLLMALPEDHLAKFHKMTDAKEMWDAIKSRFGGNDESKKMQKYILKQQFEGFSVSNTEGLHKGYDRFQSLLSQLEIHGAGVSTEDANQKFLRSLPSAWSQVSLIMRTKPGVDSLSFDDLYNNLRVFESDVKGSTASSSSPQNVAFVSENTSSTNDVSTAYCVPNPSGQNSQYEQTSSYSLLANQSSCPQLDHEDLEQIDEYDLEEMDLKWQVAMISMRMKKFYKKTGRKLQFDAKEPVGFDKTKVECYNCHKTGHFARECRIKGNQDNRRRDAWNSGTKDGSRTGKKEDSKALVTIDGEGVDWSNQSEDEDYALMACNSSDSDTEVISCSNKCKESYANLKKLYDAQREQLSDASIEIKAYSQGLKKVEAQLVAHQQGQLWYEQKIKFMKIDLDDKTDVLTYHKKMLAEAQKEKEDLKAKVEKWHNSSKNLSKLLNTQMSANDKFGLGYGDHRYDGILSYENEVLQSVFMNKESDLENQPLYDRFGTTDGMHAVPPPMTGNYMPSGPDIEVDYSQFTYGPKQTQTSESESQTSEFDACESNISTEPSELVSESVVNESNVDCQPKVWSDAPIIEEYESDSEDEYVSTPIKEKETPSFAKQQVKTPRETVKNQCTHSQKSKVDKKELGYRFTVRACFVCGSLNHLIRDCDFHEKRMARKAELNNDWNNVQRVNKQNQFVPSAVLTRTGKIPVSTARASSTKNVSTARQSFNRQTILTSTAMKVNTVKPIVNRVRPANVFYKTHSPSSRPFKKTTVLRTDFSKQKVNTGKDYPHRALKNKGIVDSGCSRHMTGNKAYLAEFQDFNGGPVAFGGSKGYITGKGKIKTGKLDFEDVCFVKELQHFNLFSVSQMCDKKNKVLFTDTECLVLSPEFKLPDENQVLLKIPRQNNMYSFNLENIVPSGGLACLIAKATTDESNKWHRRLGHVNFKNLNKLVKGNLVRGLPSKLFQNDHTCVACQKGKQHKASCKAKTVSSISHSLQLLHMDLFGPTSTQNSDYARANLDRKSTTGEAEYVAASKLLWASFCGSKSNVKTMDDKVADPTNQEAFEFWTFAKSKIINNVRHIIAKVAGKPVSISDASIRSDLLFDDANGIDSLPNQTIFDAIQLMRSQLANSTVPLYHFPVNALTNEGSPFRKPSEAQPTPSLTHPSEVPIVPQTDSSPTHPSEKLLVESWEVSDQAKEIQYLKAPIKKLKKQAKPIIKHHRAWMQSGRSLQSEPSVHKDPLFDEIPEETLDNIETENAQDVGRTSDIVGEEKEKDKDVLDIEDVLSTDKEKLCTDKEKVSTDRPIVSTDGSKVCTIRQIEGIDRQIEGTDEQIKGTDEQRKDSDDHTEEGSATQTTQQPPTSIIFRDDETIAKVLLNMSQAKAVSREKEKGVKLKDIEETDRPRPTSTRSLLTLKPLLKIDPKDKGKKKIEEEDETKSESNEKIKRSDEDFISIGSAEDERLIKKMNEKGIDSSKNEMIKEESKEEDKEETPDEEKEVDKAEHLEEINQNVVIRSMYKKHFSTLMRVLSIFDRDDLNAIYQLVMDKYQDEIPKGFDRLHGSSGVHTLVTEAGLVIHMLVVKKYPLRKKVLLQMLELKLESEEDITMALELIRFVKKLLAELEPEDSNGDEEDL
ncbi:ribonuclease H-like domain-containing protein [Tanacetum coccineum]